MDKKRKMTPEQRERRRQNHERSVRARARMQELIDRIDENRRLRAEALERKRYSLRYRLNPFRRAA
jgi:hypothetical protein